jgi:hypothetical protein
MQLILKILKKEIKNVQVIAEAKGADLVGIKYEQLMPLVLPIKILKMLLE